MNEMDESLNASQILHLALQKMDGIIAGRLRGIVDTLVDLFANLICFSHLALCYHQ